MTTPAQRQIADAFARLDENLKTIMPAFKRVTVNLNIAMAKWQRAFARGLFLDRLRDEIATERTRQARARERYVRRVTRPAVVRTTTPAFRAGTRRTKRFA